MSSEKTILLPDGRKTSDLKVIELKKELEKLGKSKSGNKMELLNRLNESFSAKIVNKSQVEKESSVVSERQHEIEDPQLNRTTLAVADIDSSNFRKDSPDPGHESTLENEVQITLSKNTESDINSEGDTTVQEAVTTILNTEKTDEFSGDDSLKEPVDLECSRDNSGLKNDARSKELEKNSIIEKSEILENEVDDIENIELENQIEVYEVDNIDLDAGQMEIYDETNKDDLIFSEKSPEKKPENGYQEEHSVIMETGTRSENSVPHVIPINESEPVAADDAEEGEVLSVPITARLGKRRIKDDEETHGDSKKPKKKGLKEIKGTGYIVEGPERIQPPQKSKHIISDVLRIDNLVRPFTLTQLQEMLETEGKVKDLWLNKIKSVAYVRYENEDIAIKARESIDGCRWPSINNKFLACDFVFAKEMEWMKEKGDTDAKPPQSFKPQQQGHTKHELENDLRSGDKRKPVNRDGAKTENNNKPVDELRKQKRTNYPESRHGKPSNTIDHRRRLDGQQEQIKERVERVREKSKEKVLSAVKLLEDIFRKTVTQPAIYWLPVSKEKNDEVMKKDKEIDRVL